VLDAGGRVRVLLFVRPTQPLAAEAPVVVDTLHHMMLTFTVFEPLHQHAFHTRRAAEYRRRVADLEAQARHLQLAHTEHTPTLRPPACRVRREGPTVSLLRHPTRGRRAQPVLSRPAG
jgi:hypothetical protein